MMSPTVNEKKKQTNKRNNVEKVNIVTTQTNWEYIKILHFIELHCRSVSFTPPVLLATLSASNHLNYDFVFIRTLVQRLQRLCRRVSFNFQFPSFYIQYNIAYVHLETKKKLNKKAEYMMFHVCTGTFVCICHMICVRVFRQKKNIMFFTLFSLRCTQS